MYYPAEHLVKSKHDGAILYKYFHIAPVTVACMGGQAQMIYYADPALAIESTTGLTDRYIAHLPLIARGRVGHEKAAPKEYWQQRRVNFMFVADSGFINDISFDRILGKIVTYDNKLMSALTQYPNVKFVHFPEYLDSFIANELPRLPQKEVLNAYLHFKSYYFNYNNDPGRENAFLVALRQH